jgi:hypothetical protein
MFDVITVLWMCLGAGYAAFFVVDIKVLSRRKTKA